MANVKISQLPSLSTMTDSAIIPVVASDATQQISGANLKTYFSSVTGNITAGNVLTSNQVIANGVIQSGTGLSTGGYLSVNGSTDLHDTTVTGNISAGTVTTPELTVNIIKSDDSTIVVVQDGLEVDGDAVVNGNITANYLFGNGSQLTGLAATYGNANVANYLPTFSGNISAGNISATGNITGAYILGSGSQLTNLPAPTVTQDITSNGAMSIMTYDGTIKYVSYATVEPSSGNIRGGNISAIGNISGNYFIGNGSQLTGISSGSANTGNVTFSDQVVVGTGSNDGSGGLYLAPGNASIANSSVQYLRVRGGDNVTHIHFDTGNNAYYDQYFGNDSKYVKLEAGDTGNVVIGTDDTNGNYYTWSFASSGNLTVPGNIQTITTGFPFTSSISGINTGNPTVLVTLTDAVFGAPETGQVTISSVVGTTQANNTWYYLSIDPSNFQLYYDSALQNPVDGTGWTTYVSGGSAVAQGYNDISIIGGNVNIVTNTGNTWTFGSDGRLTFPGTPRIDTDSDNFEIQAAENISLEANTVVNIYTDSSGNTYQWQFGDDGSLTLPIGVSIDASVDPQYPKIIADSGKLFSVQGQGNTGSAALAWTVDPNAASQYAAVSVSRAGGDNLAKVVLQAQSNSGNAATAKTWKFDETGNLTLPGNLVIAGNANVFGTNRALIQPANDLPLIALSSGANGAVSSVWVEDIANVGTSNIAAVYANPTSGSKIVRIVVGQNGVGGGPNLWDFDAVGTLTLPGGSRLRPLGANLDIFAGAGSYVNLITTDESTSVGVDGGGGYITTAGGTWDFDTTGNLTVPGNIIMTTGIVGSGASPAPYLSGFSSLSAITVSASGNISATGNVTAGNILTAGLVSATGNITTAGNFVGNGAALTNVTVSVAGNIVGTQSNVTLVAGSYNWTFDNTGNLTLPGNTFAVNYANNTPVNAVTRFESAWTVPVGNSTQSFTVTPNETYYMWVDCNIPNGILTWNATATVTNTNVPVVGAQYAWVYNGGGSPIDFTSIPNQFIGTSNTIVRSSVAPSATTNRFDFGINNISGASQTVRYGWIAIS